MAVEAKARRAIRCGTTATMPSLTLALWLRKGWHTRTSTPSASQATSAFLSEVVPRVVRACVWRESCCAGRSPASCRSSLRVPRKLAPEHRHYPLKRCGIAIGREVSMTPAADGTPPPGTAGPRRRGAGTGSARRCESDGNRADASAKRLALVRNRSRALRRPPPQLSRDGQRTDVDLARRMLTHDRGLRPRDEGKTTCAFKTS